MRRIRFLNPRSDRSFVGLVQEAMASGVSTPRDLQDRLRTAYPAAVVRERGLAWEVEPIWYVYRDGHWVPDSQEGQDQR